MKIWHWATPKGGKLTVSVDRGEAKTVELYREFANHVICPIAEGLDNTFHTVTVTLESSSYGSAMDIRYFLISGSNEHAGVTLNNGAD